ncbi:MAG: class I SAM-dependent methyltransferase [Alphaproteobacteria bacterium]|nr:class I SAM-dependent methyltransferase [Alphaproteobacteria bacterium]
MRTSSGHPVVAAVLDLVMWPLESVRRRVPPLATGKVLEIGVGTGLNAGLYDPSRVLQLVGIEPDPHMLKRAQPRFDAAGYPVELVQVGAEDMPFEDAAFDTVVVTFTLCTIPKVEAAVKEMHRVLAPGGSLHFAEHTRSDSRAMAAVQDALNPVWGLFSGGCNLNRDAVGLLRDGGFDVEEVHGHGRSALSLTPIHRGRAVKK